MRNGSQSVGTTTPAGFAFGVWFSAVFLTAALLMALLVTLTPGQQRRRRIARGAARAVFRLSGTWPHIAGLEHLPNKPAVVVANHASYLDGILLTAVLPASYRFVIKREVTQVPVMHFLLRRIGALFVERFNNQRGATDMRRILQAAHQGDSIAFFPEGTFRTEPGLRRFRNGAFALATSRSMPVVPVAIAGTRAMLPAERSLPRPGRLAVTILEPVQTDPDADVAALIDRCRAPILATIDEPDLLAAREA